MKYFTLITLLALACCKQADTGTTKKKSIKPLPIKSETAAACNYEQRKTVCKKLFSAAGTTNSQYAYNGLAAYFADSLLSCWYGTPWDYNGCTTLPQQGSIACGYFITTTLQDAGLAVNRIKMAQCPSSKLIRAVCSGIKTYSNRPIEYFISEIKKSGAGLYIAGLDFHTGFIYYDGGEVYFIHSSFYGSRCVIKEKAAECTVLKKSKLKMTGRINFTKTKAAQ